MPSSFKLYKWTLLGALYGTVPLTILVFLADTPRVSRNVFMTTFFAAIPIAYIVGMIYRKKLEQGRLQSLWQRVLMIGIGATIAAAPIVVITPFLSIAIENFKGEELTTGDVRFGAMVLSVALGALIAILGGFATGVLMLTQNWRWIGSLNERPND